MNRDIVEVLREGAKAYADAVGGGHAYRYSRAADEIERLRAGLRKIVNQQHPCTRAATREFAKEILDQSV